MPFKLKPLKLVVTILLAQGAGFLGSLVTTPSIATWYVTLAKPAFNPPNSIFAPVWTVLFLMMGVSFYLYLESKGSDNKGKLLFLAQLALNFMWSLLFFGLQNPGAAFIEIVVLWIFIALTIVTFGKISKIAAWLLVPYLLWVSFAAVLNLSIFLLN